MCSRCTAGRLSAELHGSTVTEGIYELEAEHRNTQTGNMRTWILVVVCLLLAATHALAGIFDFDIDPLYAFAFNRNNLINNGPGAECMTAAGDHGVCKSALDCKVSGGDMGGRGSCFLHQCCVYSGICNSVSSKRVSYFNSPRELPQNDCRFTINVANINVCQLRIDFDEFNLAPARQTGTSGFECIDDLFSVQTPNNRQIPNLCGFNTGQHMYIPVNASNNENTVTLSVTLGSRNNNQLITPRWNIRITQLECPVQSKIKGTHGSNVERDSWALAPAGCLQYFTDRRGTVSSFGLQPGSIATSRYTGNLDYSICIKRQPDTCGIRWTVAGDGFQLGTGSPCNDYVFIPESVSSDVANSPPDYRYCGTLASEVTLQATYPGPLHINFHSDGTALVPVNPTDPVEEQGFRLTWEVLSGRQCN